MLLDANSIKIIRQIECYLRFSVLNCKVSVNKIGPHDFVESCHTIYSNIKHCIIDWSSDDAVNKEDFDIISGCVEVFFQYSLMPFLSDYHKSLWKRHDVPRKFFCSVGENWDRDVENLKLAAKSLRDDFIKVVHEDESDTELPLFIEKLVLLKYKLDVDFSDEAYVEWNHAREIVDNILLDFDWEEYENWQDNVNFDVVKNLTESN